MNNCEFRITSIGEGCFLQNWLLTKFIENNIDYYENILSRIAKYNPISFEPIILDKLQNYQNFYQNFQKTSKIILTKDNSRDLVSDVEHCRIHYSDKMNLEEMYNNLFSSYIFLYYWPYFINKVNLIKHLTDINQCLTILLNHDFSLICFTPRIDNDITTELFQIIRFPADEKICYDKKQSTSYVKYWNVPNTIKNILEKQWNFLLSKYKINMEIK